MIFLFLDPVDDERHMAAYNIQPHQLPDPKPDAPVDELQRDNDLHAQQMGNDETIDRDRAAALIADVGKCNT